MLFVFALTLYYLTRVFLCFFVFSFSSNAMKSEITQGLSTKCILLLLCLLCSHSPNENGNTTATKYISLTGLCQCILSNQRDTSADDYSQKNT